MQLQHYRIQRWFYIFLSRSNANGGPSLHKKLSLKRQGSTVQDPSNERPLKRRDLVPREDDNMKWVRREIAGIKGTLGGIASEAREDRKNLISMLEELDFAGIKESLDEMTYDTKEERDNLHSMLEELLVEVQQRE